MKRIPKVRTAFMMILLLLVCAVPPVVLATTTKEKLDQAQKESFTGSDGRESGESGWSERRT